MVLCDRAVPRVPRAHARRACALLACRAMADSAGLASATALANHGVRLHDTPGLTNEVGEAAVGVEQVPERVRMRVDVREGEFVLVPGGTSLANTVSLSHTHFFWLGGRGAFFWPVVMCTTAWPHRGATLSRNHLAALLPTR